MLDRLDSDRRDASNGASRVDPPGDATRIGILPLIEGAPLRAAWASERLHPELRMVILTADILCREHGGRLRVTQLLGEGIYSSGTAADVLPLNLPPDHPQRVTEPSTHLAWLVRRLNELAPYGDGDIATAVYVPATQRVRLRVPPRGFSRDSMAFASWFEFGTTPGEVKNPRRLFT